MKKKLQKAIKKLQISDKDHPSSKFTFKSQESENFFKAKISYQNNSPLLEIYQSSGYNPEELKLDLNHNIDGILASPLSEAKSKSKVYVRKNSIIGTTVTLDHDTYYYAIDNSIFSCSGQMLGRDFAALCIGVGYRAKCSPTSEINEYTIYKLL